jgi:hypothetical protein
VVVKFGTELPSATAVGLNPNYLERNMTFCHFVHQKTYADFPDIEPEPNA